MCDAHRREEWIVAHTSRPLNYTRTRLVGRYLPRTGRCYRAKDASLRDNGNCAANIKDLLIHQQPAASSQHPTLATIPSNLARNQKSWSTISHALVCSVQFLLASAKLTTADVKSKTNSESQRDGQHRQKPSNNWRTVPSAVASVLTRTLSGANCST